MAKSLVERSPNRRQIENMILEGETDRFISDWTKKKGNPIGKSAINNYRKKYNAKQKAKEKYQDKKSKERLDKAVDKIVSDLDYCDNIISLANEVDLQVDPDNKITELDIKKLGLQAIKTKQEIFKQGSNDEREFTIRIVGVDSDEDDNLETEQETSE